MNTLEQITKKVMKNTLINNLIISKVKLTHFFAITSNLHIEEETYYPAFSLQNHRKRNLINSDLHNFASGEMLFLVLIALSILKIP